MSDSRIRIKGRDRCYDCGDPPAPDYTRCERCTRRHRKRQAARVAELKTAGLCVVCGRKTAGGLTTCSKHRAYYRARNRRG